MSDCFDNTAEILIEALPYIQRLDRKTVVIKYGGNAMTFNPAGNPTGAADRKSDTNSKVSPFHL